MKISGIVLLIASLAIAVYAFQFNTMVEIDALGKIESVELKDTRSQYYIASVVIAFIGALFLFLSEKATKKCPQCAENVKINALVCKHCGNKFQPET